MNPAKAQQHAPQTPASESMPLTASRVDDHTRFSASAISHLNREPFPLHSKPFEHPMYGSSTTIGGLPPSARQTPTVASPTRSSDHKKQSTHHLVDRPWAIQPAQQALKGPVAHPLRASQHSDPLLRWQAETTSEGPYHIIASVSGHQHNSYQSWTGQEAQRTVDVPSRVSAAQANSRDVKQ